MTSSLPTHLSHTDLAVTTRGLCKRYGAQTALRDVPLQVPQGAFYLLVGPNGAGKSSLLKILLDLVRPDTGVAEIFGVNVQRQGPMARANVGYVPERPDWGYGWMRVGRLLEHHARYFPAWDRAYAARLMDVFQLQLDRQVGVLSKGQARRVHLIMALAHRPPLLLLDEPTDGLDPLMRDETLGVLADHLANTPTTVLLSTHHVEEVERLADHIGVLRDGELRAQLSREALQRELRSYRVEVPDGWQGVPSLNGTVLTQITTSREVQWTVWGSEPEITRQFESTNATVRETSALSLLDATLAMLNRKEYRP
ncbi:MAG TPA: ABC transporter ATP-binding protein [Gemmatimonadaceae bacterium]|jgi:ABC-2 type transport system ATP-binding protein|nr:ABC transporter ATP-binding protein [Gemmatimonadaceae bacterium]